MKLDADGLVTNEGDGWNAVCPDCGVTVTSENYGGRFMDLERRCFVYVCGVCRVERWVNRWANNCK